MNPYELENAIRHRTMDALLEDTSLSWQEAERRAVRALAPEFKARLAAKRRQPSRHPSPERQSASSPLEQLKAKLDQIDVRALRSRLRYRIAPARLAAMEAELEGNDTPQRVFGVIEGGKGPRRKQYAYRGLDGLVYLKSRR